MYAVFESGGKQHRVAEGDLLSVELLDVEPGKMIDFEQVLLVKGESELKLGTPYVEGGKVTAEVVTHGRADKVKVVKFKRRKHHHKQMGHRQYFTKLRITAISA